MTDEEKIRRLETLGKMLEVQEPSSSVEITRGQRGAYGWSIKVYGPCAFEARDKAIIIDSELKKALAGGNDNV